MLEVWRGTEGKDGKMGEEVVVVLHALGAAGPVAVVEVEAFALEDECANAILERFSMVR